MGKILVVEDYRSMVEVYRMALSRIGREAAIATTCDDGMRILQNEGSSGGFEAVISDMNTFGQLNGIEMLLKAREMPAYERTPMALVTGYAESRAVTEMAWELGKRGISIYRKPVDMPLLFSGLRLNRI